MLHGPEIEVPVRLVIDNVFDPAVTLSASETPEPPMVAFPETVAEAALSAPEIVADAALSAPVSAAEAALRRSTD
jgi:hypothetical protein